ncbi:hypothetical protein C3942_07435 [Solimonas fluminis]|uniref:Bacterial toxin 44 domain-containing protein n=2 Tax=Solimonas fluminis TaxID=2086571 RepID=A0A2S5THW8_9GAMM|nr:hypothetical protein C3942_07435 [Solimonas fluminis]
MNTMPNTKDQSETNFLKDFLHGYDFALNLQESKSTDEGALTERPHSPASKTALRGIDRKAAQDLHNSVQGGNKRSKALMQNIEKGLVQQREGDAGYQWWKDERTFRMPSRDGVFSEATAYIHEEMMRNAESPDLAYMRGRNAKGGLLAEGDSLLRFGLKVRGEGPWDHKNTLRWGIPNPGQVHRFKGTSAEWFYNPDDDSRYFFDVFSNIHYGYVGLAAGYPEDVLLDAAGFAQGRSEAGNKRAEAFRRGHPIQNGGHTAYRGIAWGHRGWDDPPDQAAVLLGMHLYKNYGSDLTKEDLDFELRNWAGIQKMRSER